MVLGVECTASIRKCDYFFFPIPALYMGIRATSSGNLIVIWHFACLIFTHLRGCLCIFVCFMSHLPLR